MSACMRQALLEDLAPERMSRDYCLAAKLTHAKLLYAFYAILHPLTHTHKPMQQLELDRHVTAAAGTL